MADLITRTPQGLFCPLGNFHLDPTAKVEKAIVTHAHSDHCRPGSDHYLCSTEGLGVTKLRTHTNASIETLDYGEKLTIGDVAVSLHPAGHILGSAQVRIEALTGPQRGEVWVYTGDHRATPGTPGSGHRAEQGSGQATKHKTFSSGGSEGSTSGGGGGDGVRGFEPVPCHVFITECTFGLPIYRWLPEQTVFDDINQWWATNRANGLASVIFAYSLGKSQRLLAGIDPSIGPIFVHSAVKPFVDAYNDAGMALPNVHTVQQADAKLCKQQPLVIAPQNAQKTPWLKRFGPAAVAAASGWMQIRGWRRRAGLDRGFVLSDHADWPGILHAVRETGCQRVGLVHGNPAALIEHFQSIGLETFTYGGHWQRHDEDDNAADTEPSPNDAEGGSETTTAKSQAKPTSNPNEQTDAPGLFDHLPTEDTSNKPTKQNVPPNNASLPTPPQANTRPHPEDPFVTLFRGLDRTTKTNEKKQALVAYFQTAEPGDAAWALKIMTGHRLKRVVPHKVIRQAAQLVSGVSETMLEQCHAMVGDRSETIALLLPHTLPEVALHANDAHGKQGSNEPAPPSLKQLIEDHLLPMRHMDTPKQIQTLHHVWSVWPDATERLVFHKLLSGTFRVGAAAKLVTQALAEVAGIEPAVMEHRLLAPSSNAPTADAYNALLDPKDNAADAAQPYPFFLAAPLHEAGIDPTLADDAPPLLQEADQAMAAMATDAQVENKLGPIDHWQLEPKFDGIRCQLIHRQQTATVWSRGQERLNDAFPELVAIALDLPDGTVVDGELLAWENEAPLPFQALQKRLNRKAQAPALFTDVPVALVAYDLLEHQGQDIRNHPMAERRALLEQTLAPLLGTQTVHLSPILGTDQLPTWQAAEAWVQAARERGVEGLMLKNKRSAYGTGRQRGDWWKWKTDPFTVDAILIHAQRGSGRRAGLYTDFTFALLAPPPESPAPPEEAPLCGKSPLASGAYQSDGETMFHKDGDPNKPMHLVPIAKAYSGLEDAEFEQINQWINQHIRHQRGAFASVDAELVFELAFEGLQASDRHKSGIALRFPRMKRWRQDKQPQDADTLESMQRLLKQMDQPKMPLFV